MVKVSSRYDTGDRKPIGVSTVTTDDGDNTDWDETGSPSEHPTETTDAHDASAISYDNTSSGLTADDVQEAIDELAAGGGGDFDHGWFDVEDYGAVHDGSTDDTVAIQDAIDACSANGGGTVYFPEGTYIIAGALQDTGTFNSQLEIPDSLTFREIRLRGQGKYRSILRSTWNGTISGTPAIISCGTHDSTTQNQLYLVFEHISIRGINNPKLTAIDATKAITVRFDELQIAVASWPPSQPTNTNAVGLDCPWGLNDGHSGGEFLQIEGYYTGVRPSEQFSCSTIWAAYCARVAEFRGQQGAPAYLRHACRLGRVEAWNSIRAIVFSGDQRWVWIDQLVVEHGDPAPFATVYDIDDANNYGRGFIGWHTTDYSTGVEDNLLVNGGTGLSLFGAYAKRWKLNSVVDIPTGTDPSTNPSTGFRMYAASATGHPTWRDTGGTARLFLSTGDAAGGDLSGTYPNPSVSDDSHSHTAATLPATSAGAAEHAHVMDVLYSGDGSTTAFLLPVAPVDAYSVAAYVSGVLTEVTLSGAMLTTATFGSAPASAANNIRFDIVAAVE